MAQTVFLSHAGADTVKATTVADLLSAGGVHIRLDREEIQVGDSFLTFMEQSLVDSDYYLLLWSRNALTSHGWTLFVAQVLGAADALSVVVMASFG